MTLSAHDIFYKNYHIDVPDQFNFSTNIFDDWATNQPHAPALLWRDEAGAAAALSFAQMRDASLKAAHMLHRAGVRRGDIVVMIMGRQLPWWELMLACHRLGAVVSPATIQLSMKDIKYRIGASNARCIISSFDISDKIDQAAAENYTLIRILINGAKPGWLDYDKMIAEEPANAFQTPPTGAHDDALCYFTSGTTGAPKMTIHSQASYGLGHSSTGRYWLQLKPGDVIWNISDTGWAKAAWSSFYAPWICGATIFAYDAAAFNTKDTLKILATSPITTLCAAPTLYRMLVQEDLHAFRPPDLQRCVSAGEPLNPEVIEIWKNATGVHILDGYGQTETVLLCGNFDAADARPGSMGRPAPGIELEVIDENGLPLAANIEGDIAVKVRPNRPVGLFTTYKDDRDRMEAAFRGDWYITGDRAYKDDDGYFWFVGRSDDVIISSGYRIGPFEVESTLLEHDAVAESAVVSSPDELRGEIVKAFIVLAPGIEPSQLLEKDIQDFVKNLTAPYKYPRAIEFVESLPKTVSGKIRRIDLRRKEWADPAKH